MVGGGWLLRPWAGLALYAFAVLLVADVGPALLAAGWSVVATVTGALGSALMTGLAWLTLAPVQLAMSLQPWVLLAAFTAFGLWLYLVLWPATQESAADRRVGTDRAAQVAEVVPLDAAAWRARPGPSAAAGAASTRPAA